MIKFENVCKSFGKKIIFENFSLKIPSGKTTCILGKSGCGKTTLLRLALGLEKLDSGKIIFDEKPVFSVMFQENRLLPAISVKKNLQFVGANEKNCEQILKDVGLLKEQNDLPSSLSGGMKRRVAFARALVFPCWTHLFLDEPFSAQDDLTKEKLIALLKSKLKEKTAVIVTHSRLEAEKLADNIIEL